MWVKWSIISQFSLQTRNRILTDHIENLLKSKQLVVLHLDVFGQEVEDLLCGGAEQAPAGAPGVGERHGRSQALQHRRAQGQVTGSSVLLEWLEAQSLHKDLQLVLSYMLHPHPQSLVEVGSSLVLETGNGRPQSKAKADAFVSNCGFSGAHRKLFLLCEREESVVHALTQAVLLPPSLQLEAP